MWLLNTTTLLLELLTDVQIPNHPYAILSHAWGDEEVLFHEVQDSRKSIEKKAGWVKITEFCAKARVRGFDYAWVDTCCIDKRHSAELSEAIQSMYRYYSEAAECFIYLEDVRKYHQQSGTMLVVEVEVTREQLLDAVRSTRWLSRGWTLQELLAPSKRCFFAAEWSEIEGGDDLLDTVAEASGISRLLLQDRDLLSSFCVAERMKWASNRQTTREEDIAYCLMGLFNISMPALYGEGTKKAFKRLQLEIMQTSFDMTIFAWRGDYNSSGFLAQSPADFGDIPPLGLWAPLNLSSFSMTNIGLTVRLNTTNERQIAGHKDQEQPDGATLAALQCDVQTPAGQWQIPMIYLEQVTDAGFSVRNKSCNGYRRIRCSEWVTVPPEKLADCPYEDIVVLEDEQYEQVQRRIRQTNSKRMRGFLEEERGGMGFKKHTLERTWQINA
ncbi:hypothetical protein AAE478_001003 [Parahypoxylon ruwenzoriense]